MVRITDEGATLTNARALTSALTESPWSNESSCRRPMLLALVRTQLGSQSGTATVNSGGKMSIRTTEPGQGSNSAGSMPTAFTEIRSRHEDRVECVLVAQHPDIRHQTSGQVCAAEMNDRLTQPRHSTHKALAGAPHVAGQRTHNCIPRAVLTLRQTNPIVVAMPRSGSRVSTLNPATTCTGGCSRYSMHFADHHIAPQISRNNR
jgi:hypothetical protein